jgi:phosphopantothenoylcysteine decarboxylase/phosphopantothenate--cysteine ligase
MLAGKHILLGVTGGIAAYKTAYLVRQLIKEGAEVRVIMTPSAAAFITPLTLATLSKNPVHTELFNPDTGAWNNHVDLGIWADYFIIAPATANTLSKLVSGQSDNLLTATYLSARCPVLIAPAMDLDMWAHPAVQQNITLLKERGNLIIPPEKGELASGLEGEGRMAEPENMVSFLTDFHQSKLPLHGKKVLVTAGPTYEPIDPVRFIGNRSSGLMGIEIAKRFAEKGAQVVLVLGPTHLEPPKGLEILRVETAEQMFNAAMKQSPDADFIICAAAVADYRTGEIQDRKIKKTEEPLRLELVKNADILAHIGKQKREKQVLVGFALETHDEESNARKKLETKKADLIVLNSLQDPEAGFGKTTNKITIFDRLGQRYDFEPKLKNKVAEDIVDMAITFSNTIQA